MKKTFDSVAMMREARKKLAAEWEGKSQEEIESLRKKYPLLTKRKRRSRA